MTTAADIERAQKILRRWHARARASKNPDTLADVEHIMRVIQDLYIG